MLKGGRGQWEGRDSDKDSWLQGKGGSGAGLRGGVGGGEVVSVRLSVYSLFKNMPLGPPWCLAIRLELSPEDAKTSVLFSPGPTLPYSLQPSSRDPSEAGGLGDLHSLSQL